MIIIIIIIIIITELFIFIFFKDTMDFFLESDYFFRIEITLLSILFIFS